MISEHCGLPNAMVSNDYCCPLVFNTKTQEPMWQCFLRSSTNTIRRQQYSHAGRIVDGAKLQCCAKAATPGCRQLCVKVN
jgi:reversion-inducing cysteine-rich kazal motif protein